MTKLFGHTQLRVTAAIVAIVGSATLIAAAGIPADDGVIYGCYSSATGQLRVISDTTSCRSSETAISWNQVGPAGAEGPAGPAGPEGPTGPTGPAGAGDVYSIDRAMGELPLPLYPAWQTIARFDLAAGRYAILASARLHNETSFGLDASCGVLVGSRPFDAADTVWGGGSASQTMTGVSILAEPGSVTLRCRADADAAILLQSFSLTVMTVGTGGATSTTGSTSSTAGGTTTGATTSSTTGTGSGTTGTTTTTTGTTGGTTTTGTSTTGTTGTTTGGTSGTTTGTTGGTTTGTTGTSTTGTTTGTTTGG
jgi:hypothetical protein